jgi:pilus assembly protein CpaB
MNLRTIVVVILSIVCGGAASWAVSSSRKPNVIVKEAPKPETVPVVVAKLEIPLGTQLNKQMLTTKQWPKDYLPRGVVQADAVEAVYGQTTRIKIFKDEPIIDVKFGAGRGVSSLLDEGRRAYTIETPESNNNVAGFVQTGDRVDIHFTDSSHANLTGGLATRLLLQDVQVIGVDQAVNSPGVAAKARNVTLSLLPPEVQILILAQQKGTLSLALRPDGDNEVLERAITYFSDLQNQFEQDLSKRFPQPEPEAELIAVDEPEVLAVDQAQAIDDEASTRRRKPVKLAHAFVLRGNNSSVLTVQMPLSE